jgi:tRNA threonylcarbamoyladenosine biosynthesis protein TsaE
MTKKPPVTLHTASAEATEKLGERVGQALHGGEVLELVSDLGGGKTTLVRGLARGFGSHAHVSSPTFTIGQEYKAGDRILYHFDFYRLQEAGIMADELAEATHDAQAVVVVEWGDIVADVLPADRITVHITALSENNREFTFSLPESRRYLLTELTV